MKINTKNSEIGKKKKNLDSDHVPIIYLFFINFSS